ncbi:NADH:flavorubredoxin reductase NorW [Vibrio rarus]|uniref:NADH:flavorubredoxin reductase NorW n=1 Tax=Vibrio rarus TaxID=413403 RepID=UPI0021C34E56|nr:NADH:flavorubredoxin reductase NorW [Vibrio rarus]
MNPITIIGSGFAAYQLVKSLRRSNAEVPIRIITSDKGHDYNKPDLSHVMSKKQIASDLISIEANEFATTYNVELCSGMTVSDIQPQQKQLLANGQLFQYSSLVIATGANPFIPPITGLKEMNPITLNSLQEFANYKNRLTNAQSIMVIGGGLIGVELGMDLALTHKTVTLVESGSRLMGRQLPELVSIKLSQSLMELGVDVRSGQTVAQILKTDSGYQVLMENGDSLEVDDVLVCSGLAPNVALASSAGITTQAGICVDEAMQSSVAGVYALGDCAEHSGQVRAFLQPTVISAAALSKTLLGERTPVIFPSMMVKVKTPCFPIQMGGVTHQTDVSRWNLDVQDDGIVAKAFDSDNVMIGFVTTQSGTAQSFPLFRMIGSQ